MNQITDYPTTDGLDGKEAAIRRLAASLHRLNTAVINAVNEGVTVELIRTSRYHDEQGAWGDLLVPVVRERPE